MDKTKLVIILEAIPAIDEKQIIEKIKDILNKELSQYLSVDSIINHDEHLFMQQFNNYIPEENEE